MWVGWKAMREPSDDRQFVKLAQPKPDRLRQAWEISGDTNDARLGRLYVSI